MRALVKVRNNILSLGALRVLGLWRWLRYLGVFVGKLPAIVRSRDLRPLDQALGPTARLFRVRGSRFLFDCAHCDEHVRDGSYAFGLAREIYIRDCYFRFHRQEVWNSMQMVIDLGANRGAFSVMAAARGSFVLCVEAQAHFAPVIRHNMEINRFTHYAVETALIGSGGVLARFEGLRLTMDELFDRHHIERADLIKLDIEGSEFGLFEEPRWLRRIGALSMEIHPQYGQPRQLVQALVGNGFQVAMADENLRSAFNPEEAVFVFAEKK